MAQKAAIYAVELAKQTGASLTLPNVIDRRFVVSQSTPSASSPTYLTEPIEDYLKQAATSFMEEIE